jgi:hypothetical protein
VSARFRHCRRGAGGEAVQMAFDEQLRADVTDAELSTLRRLLTCQIIDIESFDIY